MTRTASGSSVAARSARPTVDRKPTTRVPSGKSKSKPTKEPKPQRKRARRANVKTEDTSDVEMTAPTCSTQLKVLATLPIEVFMHIAKYLRPLELLLFSRMNKSLRGILMSRRAAPAWRSAELNLPRLPPCPSSLCEPQYAALLFLRECSTCGRTTSRDVDCLRLVRLCDVCRRHQAVDIDRLAATGVAFTSTAPIQLKRVHKCCLTDIDVVSIEKLTKLPDGQDAKAFWTAHGLEDIRQREKFALVLRGWIEGYDRIQKAEEDSIRKAKATTIKEKRQKDIESRLLDLGWERQDFFSNLNKREWLSLTYNTKPLNDQVWSDLLPDLLRILKQNRTRRLKQEKEIRRNQRDAMIKTWFRDIREETGLFAKAIPHGDSLGLVHPESFCWSSAKTTRTLSLQALPSADNFNQLIHLKYLAETDMSVDELKVQLSKQRKAFTDSVMEWQKHLENALLEVLPANTPTPGYAETSGFSLMAIGHYMLPFSKLSTRLQRLLRADSTFTSRSGGISFYPDDYAEWTPAKSPVKYHEKASKVAKGLLNALDRPNASYLELKALGAAFQCGVCHEQPVYMTWESLIQHYLDQEARWKLNSRSFGLRGNNIPFVCTHDVDRTNSAKPLVYIVAGSDREDSVSYIHKNSKCAICTRVGISELVHSDYIADHVRDVHLIDKPKEGTHYQLALRAN